MNGYEFWSSIIHWLAWPITVIVAILVLRGGIATFLTNISKLRYKGFGQEIEAEASKDLDRIEATQAVIQEAQALSPGDEVDSAKGTEVKADTQKLLKLQEQQEYQWLSGLAKVSPRSAIEEAWRSVERRINGLIRTYVYEAERLGTVTQPFPYRLNLVDQHRLIPPFLTPLLREMREVRNRAVHREDYDVTETDAYRYIQQAMFVLEEINAFPGIAENNPT